MSGSRCKSVFWSSLYLPSAIGTSIFTYALLTLASPYDAEGRGLEAAAAATSIFSAGNLLYSAFSHCFRLRSPVSEPTDLDDIRVENEIEAKPPENVTPARDWSCAKGTVFLTFGIGNCLASTFLTGITIWVTFGNPGDIGSHDGHHHDTTAAEAAPIWLVCASHWIGSFKLIHDTKKHCSSHSHGRFFNRRDQIGLLENHAPITLSNR